MGDLLKKLIELAFYYRTDEAKGVPYWKDASFLGTAVGVIAALVLRFTGLVIDHDLQVAIVGVGVGLGQLLNSRTGVKPHPAQAVAQQVQQANLSNLS
jgi:hypothetical protein